MSRRFPAKTTKGVGNGLRPRSIRNFLASLPLVFQPGRAKELASTYHFTFTGAEERRATIVIHHGNLTVQDGHTGIPHLHVTADAATWLGFVAKEKNLLWALLTRKVRLRGSPMWLVRFGECFP